MGDALGLREMVFYDFYEFRDAVFGKSNVGAEIRDSFEDWANGWLDPSASMLYIDAEYPIEAFLEEVEENDEPDVIYCIMLTMLAEAIIEHFDCGISLLWE